MYYYYYWTLDSMLYKIVYVQAVILELDNICLYHKGKIYVILENKQNKTKSIQFLIELLPLLIINKTISKALSSISRAHIIKFVGCIFFNCFESRSLVVEIFWSFKFFETTFFLFLYFYGFIMIVINLCPSFIVVLNINIMSYTQVTYWTEAELLFENLTPVIRNSSEIVCYLCFRDQIRFSSILSGFLFFFRIYSIEVASAVA